MNWKSLVAACWIAAGLAGAPAAFGDEAPQPTPQATPPPAAAQTPQPAPQATPAPASEQTPQPALPEAPPPELSPTDQFINNMKHPVEWFTWGGDFRIRQEYIKNAHGLLNNTDDQVNQLRFRPRIWADLGSFFSDPNLGVPNGLDLYIRLTDETRYYLTRPTNLPWSLEPPYGTNPAFNEIIVDNLYVNWDRPDGIPVSFRVGRQDLTYGRGFVILDGTPLDGSRGVYSDAAKMTIHDDPIRTDLDLFAVDNKADESRLQPIAIEAGQQEFTSDFDTKMLGAYVISKYFAPLELNAYYIYKDDTFANYGVIHQLFYGSDPMGRIVHTVGGLAQGTAGTGLGLLRRGGVAVGQRGRDPGRVERGEPAGVRVELGPRVHVQASGGDAARAHGLHGPLRRRPALEDLRRMGPRHGPLAAAQRALRLSLGR